MASTNSPEPQPFTTIASPESLTPTASPIPKSQPKRTSSIRFSDNTSTISRSPMSTRRPPSASDEITPIRLAEDAPSRSYDTAQDDPQTESEQAVNTGKTQTAPRTTDGQSDEVKVPWYKKVVEKYGPISLENKGSVARDHLALERTFLAWLRTSLAFASIGIAITQLFRLNTNIADRSERRSIPLANPNLEQSGLPYSPLLGESIPVEVLPYLQQALASAVSTAVNSVPTLGPTLLDQLLLLPPPGTSSPGLPSFQSSEFDDHAAARLRHVGKPLGATFLGIAIIILLIGFHRYFESQHWIIRGKFPASRGSIFIVGFITGSLIIASMVVVIVIAPT